MSSLIVCNQGTAIHVVTDGAAYTRDGVLTDVEQKVVPLPRQQAAVYTRGPSRMVWQAGLLMSLQFERFDDMVDGLEPFARDFFAKYFDALNTSGFPELEINIFGWSEQKKRTEAFLIRCAQPGSWLEVEAGSSAYKPQPFAVMKMTDFVASHGPTPEDRRGAQYPNRPIKLVSEVDLLHLFEIQRRQRANKAGEVGPNAERIYDVGGYALLTTVTKDEVRQKVLARYPEDVPGQPIQPAEIDWKSWRAEHDDFTSRLRRGITERRERKVARR